MLEKLARLRNRKALRQPRLQDLVHCGSALFFKVDFEFAVMNHDWVTRQRQWGRPTDHFTADIEAATVTGEENVALVLTPLNQAAKVRADRR